MLDTQFSPDWFSTPGDTVSKLMARQAISIGTLATHLDWTSDRVKSMLAGVTEIDEEAAHRLSSSIGGSPSFWTKRQSQFDSKVSEIAAKIPDRDGIEWLRSLPLKDMTGSGRIAGEVQKTRALCAALAYFRIRTPHEWDERYGSFVGESAFRTSPSFASKIGAIAAWLRKAELEAELIDCAKWNSAKLLSKLNSLRELTLAKSPAFFLPRLKEICASFGVALVVARTPAGCSASGATRFLSSSKAMLVVSFRHLSDDHFWFTFFHELGHLVLHGQNATFVDTDAADKSEKEHEADQFSETVLIPVERRDGLANLAPRVREVVRYAVSVGVSPGIVVGQMQHFGFIGPQQLNSLKRRYSWDEIDAAIAIL